MYMERIVADMTGVRQRPKSARLAAGSLVLILGALAALPFWIALMLWIPVVFLLRGAARLGRLCRDTALYAGDLVLGESRTAWAAADPFEGKS
jgi:hypothetical protein